MTDRPVPRLAVLAAAPEARPAANCRLGQGCGGGPGRDELTPELRAQVASHPCYSEEAHHHFARLHVAVAPACNIQCHYCNRKYDCAAESRPGVVSARLTPEQAAARVSAVARELPQLSVVGIAGPGDALANPEATFRTCELVRRDHPDLTLCLSTNGLALPDHVERLVALGIRHVTVTINMLDPEVGERIYAWVAFRGKRHRGREAARLLSERQLEGLAALAGRGVLCKVNSVLIPGVNDAHLAEVGRKVRALGAFTHNVMPLIARPEHGTHYGLTGQREPTAAELEAVQARLGGGRLMRHCRQCRADAVGLLGEDRGAEFAAAGLAGPAPQAAAARAAHRVVADRRRAAAQAAEGRARAEAAAAGALTLRVAVTTKGGGQVNEHFGHARELHVYDASAEGARLVGIRKIERYCAGGEGEDGALDALLAALSDCQAVLTARIGRCPAERLRAAGVEAVQDLAQAWIEEAVLTHLARFADRVARGEATPPSPRPGAALEVA